MPERLDTVRIRTRRGDVTIPWLSREALLVQLETQDANRDLVNAFRAVGASRPVELTDEQQGRLHAFINEWSRQAGGLENLPPGIWNVRRTLAGEM